MATRLETSIEAPACPNVGPGAPLDLTWLLHRGAQVMRTALDEVARDHGLTGLRDWLVLTALGDGRSRTQLALGHELGVDKTTLTALLDRLERDGLIVRHLDPNDRRARIPESTKAGKAIAAKIEKARDAVEVRVLAQFSADDQNALRELLTRLAESHAEATGSCI